MKSAMTIVVAVVLAVVTTQVIQIVSYNNDRVVRTNFINAGNTPPPPKTPPLACMVFHILCPDMMTM